MASTKERNPLKPWYIGVTIVALSNLVFLYYIMTHDCAIPNVYVVGLLVVLPMIYLVLMYFDFTSQK